MLLKMINHPDSKAHSQLTITDNAMSAVARICCAFPGRIDLASVLPSWSVGLPVTHDEDEAPIVYTWLIGLLSENPTLILGSQGERGPVVLGALKAALQDPKLLKDPLRNQVAVIAQQLSSSFSS